MQFLALALLVVLVATILRRAMTDSQPKLRQHIHKLLFYLSLAVLVVLAASGRLAWILAALGGMVAAIVRFAPVLIQLFPLLERLYGRARPGGERRTRGDSPPSSKSPMSRAEALQILGLEESANRNQIIEAHRRLMQKLHPDRGGSDYLAAQINRARQFLLNE